MSSESDNEESGRFYESGIDIVVISIIFMLSCADVEVLNILQSNIADLRSFKVPFSKSAESRIFWFSFLNIFIRYIPLVFVQV